MQLTTPKLSSIDLVFRAFSDRTRLRILNLLQARGEDAELCVCDIIRVIKAPQPTISRHLSYLRRARLVAGRKEGLWVHYRLLPPANAFHRKMLECLACCLADVPELKADRVKLGKCACVSDRQDGETNCCG